MFSTVACALFKGTLMDAKKGKRANIVVGKTVFKKICSGKHPVSTNLITMQKRESFKYCPMTIGFKTA